MSASRPLRAVLCALLLLPLSGCRRLQVNEENWSETYRQAVCDYYERCIPLELDHSFGDVETCTQELYGDTGLYDLYAGEEGCFFQEHNALECLKALRGPCSEIFDGSNEHLPACERTWACL